VDPQTDVVSAETAESVQPIEENQELETMITTPHLPGAPLQRFPSAEALLLFLLAHLRPRGISRARLHQWVAAFGLERVATVAQWILSAPKGAIHNAGAWMHRALHDEWSAPSWVRQAWRRHKARMDADTARKRAEAQLRDLEAAERKNAIRREREAEKRERVRTAWPHTR
jgi:hypothetical protein